jgi:NitT/TauT family transport system substrate-binding protein
VLNWYPEPEFGGFYEGVLGDHYKAAGFDVTIVPGGPGAPTLELLGTGKAQVAITTADDILVKRMKGVPAKAVWAAFQHSPQGLMVHSSSPITSLDQIAGTESPRVAIEVGRPFHQFLWQEYGWEGKVEAVPYGGSVGPFLTDPSTIQQAYVTSEPCIADAKGSPARFLSGRDSGWNPYGTVVAVADPPPPWAADFIQATAKAWQAYLRAPDHANTQIIAQNDQLNVGLIGCITDLQRPYITGDDGLGAMTTERWEATAANLVKLELLPEGVRAKDAWQNLQADASAAGTAAD